ncbi:hypothetical protein [Streptomyces albidoflavus]|uniref:hypothetical protein n=1 Tax=Streptomyces albidoflavus TaxID=1886 RepID=UPI002271DDAF|nr:hypothetical protein [Streptomyces albidoflavus]
MGPGRPRYGTAPATPVTLTSPAPRQPPKTPPGPRPAAPPPSRAPRPVILRRALLLGAAPLVLALAAVLLTPGRWEAALGLLAVYAATCAAAAYRPGRARPGGTPDRPGATPEHPGPPALPSPRTTEPRPAAKAPPAELPASLPAPRPAHDPAVTTFGLLLQPHPSSNAPGSPYQELAAWSRALEAYDEAGRAGAEQVPGILAEGRAALTTLDRLLGLDTPAAAPTASSTPGTARPPPPSAGPRRTAPPAPSRSAAPTPPASPTPRPPPAPPTPRPPTTPATATAPSASPCAPPATPPRCCSPSPATPRAPSR